MPFPYEPFKVAYSYTKTFNRTYTPDSCIGDVIIEVKGRFRTADEAEKYLHIRNTLEDKELGFLMVFLGKNTPMPGSRRRNDGTRRSHEEWADEHGIAYIHVDELEHWIGENI